MDNYPGSVSDSKLIDECINGSRRAQFIIYSRYGKAMFNLACRMMNNREDAEDILQESFIECFRNLGSFRNESTFGAWLKRIVVNRCINQLRKKKVILIPLDPVPERADIIESDPVFEISGIIKGIGQLPDGYRIVLTLYLLEGYDHEEISQILGINESTSKSQYSRAKVKLRSIISKNGNYGRD